jgi:hypothetical protein
VLPSDPTIEWAAPEGCPDRVVVTDAVSRLAADGAATPSASARATVTQTAEGYALELSVSTEAGTTRRNLASGSCESLARAAALIIAVELDPVAAAANLETRPAPELPPPPLPAIEPPTPPPAVLDVRPPPVRPTAPRSREPAPATVHLAIRPEAALGTGLLPGAIGGAVGGAVAVFGDRAWRIEAGGAYSFPRRAVAPSSDAGGDFWMATGVVRGCGVFAAGPVRLPLCGGLEAGGVRGTGFGADVDTARVTQAWVALQPSVGLMWAPRPWIALVGRLEAPLSLRRPAFHLDGIGEVHRVGAVGARGTLGLEVRFF